MNVSKLAIIKWFELEGQLEGLWDSMAAITFESALPKLAELEVKLQIKFVSIRNRDFLWLK